MEEDRIVSQGLLRQTVVTEEEDEETPNVLYKPHSTSLCNVHPGTTEPKGTSVFWAQFTNSNGAVWGYNETISEYEWTWKEVDVAYFEGMSYTSPGMTKANHIRISGVPIPHNEVARSELQ
jgi:hypothetical protein